jgi:transposase
MQTYEELLAENAALRAENVALKARVSDLEAQLAAALERIAALEARLGMNSRNSSKPPSSDPPNVAARPKKPPSGRKRGGQPGHRGVTRSLLPPEKVSRIIELRPETCEQCAAKLHGSDPKPVRRQVTDVPPVEPDVTEYRQHTLPCDECGARTTAPLPLGVGSSAFAPRLKAMLAMSSAVYRLSRRTVEWLMADFFNVDISLGSVSACEETVSEAVAPPVAQAREYVEKAPVAHADETGFRQAPAPGEKPKKAWLWAAVTPLVTVFLVHAKRSAAAAKELLGSFAGILVSDRWSAYSFIDAVRRQLCWAHLLRDFEWIAEFGAEAAATGKGLVEQARLMFRWWHELKAGGLTRSGFQERMGPLVERVEALLAEGAASGHKKTAGRCRNILGLRLALWTFVRVEGVEPTNNAAERALRPAVLWRKGSFGSASPRGSRFVERMLTVASTCRQQGRNVLDYLVAACEAEARGEQAPSLLPQTADERLAAAA